MRPFRIFGLSWEVVIVTILSQHLQKINISQQFYTFRLLQQSNKMNNSFVYEMRGNQFPFGVLSDSPSESKKFLIKKRINYKNQLEYSKLKEQIEKLKKISHKNTINLRSTQDFKNGHIDLFYPYVPIPLEESFTENAFQTVKELHKQFIQLAIYLAKQYILTSFNPARCGVIVNQRKTLIKYYLPLNQIIITDNISMLERSVQLFNLQSMHYLDTLSQSALNNTLQNSSSQQSIQRKSHIYIGEKRKLRKESQPAILQFKSARKLSVNPFTKQMRKLSNLSKQLSEFSEMRKKRSKQSTRISAGSFNTMRIMLKNESTKDLFRSYLSESKTIEERVSTLKQRSIAAIKSFSELRYLMAQHRSASILINMIRQ